MDCFRVSVFNIKYQDFKFASIETLFLFNEQNWKNFTLQVNTFFTRLLRESANLSVISL